MCLTRSLFSDCYSWGGLKSPIPQHCFLLFPFSVKSIFRIYIIITVKIIFTTELTLHYNYLSFLVQRFVFLGVNNCLVFSISLALYLTIPNFQQYPPNFPHSNIEQGIYQSLNTSFLGPLTSFFQPRLVVLLGSSTTVLPGLPLLSSC